MRGVLTLGCGLLVAAAPGCAPLLGDFSVGPVGGDGGSEAGDGLVGDGGPTGDPFGDGGAQGGNIEGDGADVGLVDGCLGTQADANVGIFVVSGGNDIGCGAETTPCGTIQAGIDAARAGHRSWVYVAKGTYVEQVSLAPGVNVAGGWRDLAWTKDCSAAAASDVTIKAPSDSATTLIAKDVGAVTLATLSVASKDPSEVGFGESLYGIFASGTTMLTLSDVQVAVVNAGAGAPGSGGAPGVTGSNCVGAADGVSAANTPAGNGALRGSYGPDGYQPSSGGAAAAGLAGHPGTVSTTAPTCLPNSTCQYESTQCVLVQTGGNSCGASGIPGCGGGPATPGSGGGGGGSSIALYVWGATVGANSGSLATGNGGAGGAGSPSMSGGLGSPGQTGAQGSGVMTLCVTTGVNQCESQFGHGLGGGPGGSGGTGAGAGAGGGGAGGDSYAWYSGGGGSVTTNGSPLVHGAAGPGGPGGAAGGIGGSSGTASAHN